MDKTNAATLRGAAYRKNLAASLRVRTPPVYAARIIVTARHIDPAAIVPSSLSGIFDPVVIVLPVLPDQRLLGQGEAGLFQRFDPLNRVDGRFGRDHGTVKPFIERCSDEGEERLQIFGLFAVASYIQTEKTAVVIEIFGLSVKYFNRSGHGFFLPVYNRETHEALVFVILKQPVFDRVLDVFEVPAVEIAAVAVVAVKKRQ